jgi:putative nucleotidyltransferase with HDIG domain
MVRASVMGVILALCLALVLFLPHVVVFPRLKVGDVSPVTIEAPRTLTIVDQARTNATRQVAASRVATQFRVDAAPQKQADALATALFHAAATPRTGRKPADLQAEAGVLVQASGGTVSSSMAQTLLTLSPGDRAQVTSLVQEALRVTAAQAVYPTQLAVLVAAPPFPPSLPNGLVRTTATALFSLFLRPNRFPDAGLTTQAQQRAAANVPPITVTYQAGQVIVRSGDVVDANAVAALHAAGLDGTNATLPVFLADLMISVVVAGLLHGYLISIRSPILLHYRQLLLLDVIMVCSLSTAAFIVHGHAVLPYVFPVTAISMLLTVLLNGELSMLAATMWAVLTGWYLANSFEMTTYYIVTGLAGALLVRNVRRSSEFFLAGLGTSVLGLLVILAFRFLDQQNTLLDFGTYAAGAFISGGLAAALTLGSLSLLGRLFGVTTALHLLELSHPNHPLLRRLMQEAPGTYHHSMMIGTLAERAAEMIGADPLLVRVQAYFHDVGKLINPIAFAENQSGIANIHDSLEPRESARIIIEHVYEGVRLARQYHLPEVLEDGIWQHHGTNLVSFFYQNAVAFEGEEHVDIQEFRYPGPRPQSRETAILMLADAVEATVRSSPGVDGAQIRAIIHRLSQQRLQDGQLDECSLTLRDLSLIEESFATVLQGFSHPRVQYPAPLPAVGNG